jgi:nitroreductase
VKPEQIAQCQMMDWIRSIPDVEPYVFHIGNERQTSPQQGRLLKRMGVRAGVSDLFIGIAKGKWHGMFLELKVGNNKPTKAQEQFMLDFASQGYYCVWCQGFDEARVLISEYLRLSPE